MGEETLSKILIGLGAGLTILFCMVPFIYMVATGLSTSADFLQRGNSFSFTIQNYYTILFSESSHFVRYMVNSIVISGIAAMIAVFCAALGPMPSPASMCPGGGPSCC